MKFVLLHKSVVPAFASKVTYCMSNKGGCTATHFQLNISTSSRKPLYFQFFLRGREDLTTYSCLRKIVKLNHFFLLFFSYCENYILH